MVWKQVSGFLNFWFQWSGGTHLLVRIASRNGRDITAPQSPRRPRRSENLKTDMPSPPPPSLLAASPLLNLSFPFHRESRIHILRRMREMRRREGSHPGRRPICRLVVVDRILSSRLSSWPMFYLNAVAESCQHAWEGRGAIYDCFDTLGKAVSQRAGFLWVFPVFPPSVNKSTKLEGFQTRGTIRTDR